MLSDVGCSGHSCRSCGSSLSNNRHWAGNIAGPEVTVAAGQNFQVMGDPSTYQVEEFIPNITAGRPGVKVAQFLGNTHRDFYLLEAAPDRDKTRGGPVYFRIKRTNILEYTGPAGVKG